MTGEWIERYRRMIAALRLIRVGLVAYLLVETAAVISVRVDGAHLQFVVAARGAAFALAAITTLGMWRFANAAVWGGWSARFGAIANAVFGLGIVGIVADDLRLVHVSIETPEMVAGFGLLAALVALAMMANAIAHAMGRRRIGDLVMLLAVTLVVGIVLIGNLINERSLAKPTAQLIAAAWIMGILVADAVAVTKLVGALRERLAEPPRAVVHVE